jgi:hypothetical protein
VVRLVKEKFVPLAVDGRVIRYFNDAEMEFLRAPTKCVNDGGGNSIPYVVAASGTRVHMCNSSVPDRKTLQLTLEQGLEKWAALPASERTPGAVQVGERPAVDPKRARQSPPEGALIVHVYNRQLGHTAEGKLRYTIAADYVPAMRESRFVGIAPPVERLREVADDTMWVLRPEWQVLMPSKPQKGQRVKLPTSLVQRIIRFHLDPARGNCEWMNFTHLEATDKVVQLTLTVEEATADEVRMRLEGLANLREDRGANKGGVIAYQPRLLGCLAYNPAKKTFTRFDIVALGDVTGQPADENPVGERLGSKPLGIAFELAVNPKPADYACPRGQRDVGIPGGSLTDVYLLTGGRLK